MNGTVVYHGQENQTMNNFSATSNINTTLTLVWTSGTRFSLFILLSVLVTNSGVLYLFFRHPSLFTPFTVYVLNLLFANILRTLLCYPLELINSLYDTWWSGWTSCTVSLYGTWVMGAAMCNAHMLIALNRLWAITFPHSYRTRHTARFAILTCLAMWIYVHTGLLPGVIMDAMWYRKHLDTDGCMLNTASQMTWSYTIQAPYYALPYMVVILVYPTVCYKLWRTSHPRIGPVSASVPAQATNSRAGAESRTERTNAIGRSRAERNGGALLILTSMTFTMLVCYGPMLIFYMAAVYWDLYIPGLSPVGSVFYELMAVLDPLLFALTIGDLRRVFRQVYCGCT